MKRKVPLLFIFGVCLILISLCITLFLGIRMYLGNQKSHQTVTKILELLPDRTTGIPGIYSSSGMPILEIDGVDYMAVVEIPAYGNTLPVSDKWDSGKLYTSPCRYFGSAYDHTLVIGGVDSPGQFDFCDKIQHNATITVTDMTGSQFNYTVARIDRSKHADNGWLMHPDFDLTLFCRDTLSMEYIAVRCNFSYK